MTLIRLENIPPGSHVGLDLHSWQSGPNFRGIKDVPEGIHCLHVTIADVSLTKYAVWLDIKTSVTTAFAWRSAEQKFVKTSSNQSMGPNEEMFFVACPPEPDRHFEALSKHLGADTVSRFVKLESVLTSTSTSNVDPFADELKRIDTTVITGSGEYALTFTPIDLKRSWRPGAIGRELTDQSLDKSWLLHDTLSRCSGADGFLAEFEFCTLSVLLYGSLAACDHFNTMLLLVANSKTALLTNPAFFEGILDLLHLQMQQVPEDLFADFFALNVPQQVAVMQRNVKELMVGNGTSRLQGISENIEILLDFLHREFNVEHVTEQAVYPGDEDADSSESEPDDEKPVVVENV
ncbi:A1 cistron-splicing factor [Protomyces lactucae-debilis]|uniref:A1 cistron-splicing factor n=1 Tax=Protomyces lactucae-debilis TaxID=2754530 RepID=A0A1Y2FE17_PROLT|nr:A1 cistron-splicing factor [Protomyces lactucae-debilis]ORY81556.1 A1 cistron-splicing factor [Protomyces lactucae-debilis]